MGEYLKYPYEIRVDGSARIYAETLDEARRLATNLSHACDVKIGVSIFQRDNLLLISFLPKAR